MILQKLSAFFIFAFGLATAVFGAGFLKPQVPLHMSSLTKGKPEWSTHSSPIKGCDLTGAIYPSGDGLPSADHLFGTEEAFRDQLERLQDVVAVDTVCYDDLGDVGHDDRWEPFGRLQGVLEDQYPLLHDDHRVTLEKINTYGLVYTIKGHSHGDLKPILFMAHQDVVPIGNESSWTYEPFSAEYDGEWVWGRGVGDDKNRLTAIMSVFEKLLTLDDWHPRRTFILAFGFDEECSGPRGARNIGKHLHDRYGQDSFEAIVDEGGLGMIQLGDTVYAAPGVQEKGFVNIWLDLHTEGGHSSVPPPNTGIGIMSQMVVALENNPYMPKLIRDSPIHKSLACLARYSPHVCPEITHLVKHDDLEELTQVIAEMGPVARALVQTTQAVDVIQGGDKINSLPEFTIVGVNYRVAPQDSVLGVQHKVLELVEGIADTFNLKIEAYEGDDEYHEYVASIGDSHRLKRFSKADHDYSGTLILQAQQKFHGASVSPDDTEAWRIFAGTIESTFAFPGGRVVPAGVIMTGNTDSKHYLDLSENIYRWNPHLATDIQNFHAVDERLRAAAHIDVVKFYYNLVRNFDNQEAGWSETQQEL